MRLVVISFGILVTCFLTYADAENAYGDHGIVFTAGAAKVDEDYQNIVSVPSTPTDIDNKTEQYPGFNFGFVFRQPISCGVDYSRNELYVYDYYLRGLLLLQNYNSSAIKEEITITQQHYGVSKEYSRIAVDWISHNVYWTDPLMGWIAVQPGGAINNVTRYKIVHRKLHLPRAIAIDPMAGYLFWSEFKDSSIIKRSTLTGEDEETIIFNRLTEPNSIVTDFSAQRIYWTDVQFIYSATYDGTDRKQIVRDTSVNFFNMAIFKNILITTDVYSAYTGGDEFYARFYDKTSGKELTDKRITVSREVLYGTCIYHAESQPAKPEQDRCKTAGCQDICVNEPTKATCMCSEGFMLDTDGKSCKENGGQHYRAVIVSTGRSLCLLDIRVLSDKHDYTPDCFYNGTGSENITIFEVNMVSREVYFAVGSTINKVSVDKDGRRTGKTVIENQSYNITGMSYDYASGRLYFAVASNPPQLWYMNVNTFSAAFQHNVDGDDLRSLTVIPSQNKAYWLASVNLLQSVDLAGVVAADIENLTLIYHPRGREIYPKRMVHDNTQEKLFVLIEGYNGHSDFLAIDYNGNATQYLPTADDIIDFVIYKEYIVLVTRKDGKYIVRSADLGLGYPLSTVDEGNITGLDEIYAIKVLDAGLQEKIQNPCGPSSNNGDCEHICLPSDASATCKCKLGFTLQSDGKHCVSSPVDDDFILFTDLTFNEILQIPLNDPTRVIGIRTPATDRADGVLYNYQTGEVMWTSTTAAQIWAVRLNDTRLRTVSYVADSMIGYPDQLALDPSTGNIYYTTVSYYSDSLFDSLIVVANKKGEQTIVVWDGHRPRDIEVDPAEGLMFWTDYSSSIPAVYRANMDGSEKKAIHTQNLTWPNGIALDYPAKRIYWTDGYLDRIYYSDYDGGNREVFMEVEEGLRLMDLELVGDYLFYTSMGSETVTRVHKNNKNDVKQFGLAGLGRLYGLDVYSSSAQTNTPVNTGCSVDNGGCSHFCLPKVGGHSCGCNLYVELLQDGKTCEDAQRCSMTIANGEIIQDPTCVGAENNTCAYTCNIGYKPRASVPKITCTSNMFQLNWDIQDPCEMVKCPDYIENGVVLGTCSLRPDDVCLYRCNDGFEPNPAMTHIMCQANGTWDYSANNTVLCTLKTTATTVTPEKAPMSSKSSGKNVGMGVGIGVGVLVLIVIIVVLVVFLIRSGRISSPLAQTGKPNTGTAFENPRYADNDVQLGSAGGEANTSFGYTTLDEEKVAASTTNTTYDNIVPRI